ncbi:MAG: AlkZ family DNA glycosylase [Candidatus Micrarchaeota archaeon]|nr:AlkZ family DNA glycosylase [Candidatus Micrarchaeota archaeon]
MDSDEIADMRLLSQGITSETSARPEDVVSRMGAMQAQDYDAAMWAIGLRCRGGVTKADVESAIDKRRIARTWLMRGTLHFAHSNDIGWMLKLFAPRLIRTAMLRDAHLGLSDKVIDRTMALFEKALKGGRQLSRKEMYGVMRKGNVPTANNLGYHMLYRAAWDGLICFGLHDGKQPTFALMDEWLPKQKGMERDDALKELARRYFSSHGPATVKDYVWWSGLKVSEAMEGIGKASGDIKTEEVKGVTYYFPKKMPRQNGNTRNAHLLPAFDEYLVSYSDRSAMLDSRKTQEWLRSGKMAVIHSNGIFTPVIVIDGKVVGAWKRSKEKKGISVRLVPFGRISKEHMAQIKDAVEDYGRFFGTEAMLKA